MKKPSSWKGGVTKARVAEKFVVKRTKSALKSMGVLVAVSAFGLLAFANAEPRPSGPYAFVKPDPQVRGGDTENPYEICSVTLTLKLAQYRKFYFTKFRNKKAPRFTAHSKIPKKQQIFGSN